MCVLLGPVANASSARCYSRSVSMTQKGAVYLLDYEVLDGIPANEINGKQTYLSAPLCLLHLNQQGQLLPIAIQVSRRCSEVLGRSRHVFYRLLLSCSRPPGLRTRSSCPLTTAVIGCWLRSGFAAQTSSVTSWSPTTCGLTCWRNCAAWPRCDTSQNHTLCTRSTPTHQSAQSVHDSN